jgi:hypothetical protein
MAHDTDDIYTMIHMFLFSFLIVSDDTAACYDSWYPFYVW